MGYYFGIDGGGSTTICAIADSKGSIVSIGQSGSANYKLVGTEAAKRNVAESLRQAQSRANIRMSDLDCGFFAISGLDGSEDRSIIDRFIKEISPTDNYALDNDAIASLVLGTSEGYGVVLIFGTGSNCVAVNRHCERLQVGGLGREFGDFCGGREIAIQAMGAAVRGWDGRGPATNLYKRITEYLDVENLIDFTPVLHYSGRSYPIANLVPLVFDVAEQGDQVALDILKYNGEELALSAEVAIEKLFSGEKSIEVVLTGGVFRRDTNRILIDALQDKVKARFPQVQFRIPSGEPVIGALIKAMQKDGFVVTAEHKEGLVGQLTSFNDILGEF